MAEYEEIYEREGEKFLRRDFIYKPGDEFPNFPSDPTGFKIILKDEDDRYYSTYIYSSLDEAMGDAVSLAASYGLNTNTVQVIISTYFPM